MPPDLLFILAFPTGRDSETFRDNETEVSSLSRDKGTTGQAKNLAKGQYGSGQPKSGTGRAGTAKNRDETRDKTGQSRKGLSKTRNLYYYIRYHFNPFTAQWRVFPAGNNED